MRLLIMKPLIALCVLWLTSLVILKLRGKTFSMVLKAAMDADGAKEFAASNPIAMRFVLVIVFAFTFTVIPFVSIVWAIRDLIK